MNIAILGCGYVGLTTGLCFTEKGHKVICFDVDKAKLDLLQQGKLPIFEPGLEEIFKQAKEKGLLQATSDLSNAVKEADAIFIAVGTPMRQDKSIDISFVENAARQLGNELKEKQGFPVIVIKSTVVPGTTQEIVLPLLEQASGKKAGTGFGLCMNPEFLREGSAVKDFNEPDRIVLGCLGEKEKGLMQELYSAYNAPFVLTNLPTAEMIKYANNSLIATLISFSNEFANLCEKVPGVSVEDVLKAVHLDFRLNPIVGGKRLNPNILTYLRAGCGFGGSCFPKDLNALIHFSEKKGYSPELLKSVVGINQERAGHLVERLSKELGSLDGKTVGILGLAFKPETDDVRESQALKIIQSLLGKGTRVSAHDPMAVENAKRFFGSEAEKISFFGDLNSFLKEELDAMVLVTAWPQYREIDFATLGREVILVDGRGFFNREKLPENVRCVSVGFKP